MTDSSMSVRGPDILDAATSRLLIVDVQDKLLPAEPDVPGLIAGCRFLIGAAEVLSVPVTITEQYPQGLGPTTAELAKLCPPPVVKQTFSCWPALNWPTAGDDLAGRFQIVLAGMEAHVCVLQTAFDLQAAGYRVFVAADAVRSRRETDRQLAFQRMTSAGITLVAAESIAFEWCQRSDRPEFKAISKLVKERPL